MLHTPYDKRDCSLKVAAYDTSQEVIFSTRNLAKLQCMATKSVQLSLTKNNSPSDTSAVISCDPTGINP